jgi:hypothetical protein
MGGYSRDFKLLRCSRTYACMKVIKEGTPSWEWSEKSVVAFKADYDAVIVLLAVESDEAADASLARGTRDANLEVVIAKAQLGAGSLRIKFRNTPEKLRLFTGLQMNANSIQGKLAQVLKFESAWEKTDAAYVLEDGTTLAQFVTLRESCGTDQEEVTDEGAEENIASGDVRKKLDALYELAVAWYGVAILKYPEGTVRGDFIRGYIPTEPAAGGAAPEQAVLTAEPGIGQATLTVVAVGASRYTIWYRLAGATDWIEVVVGHESGSFTHTGLAAGNYEYKARGHNNNDDGPESEIVSVEVT